MKSKGIPHTKFNGGTWGSGTIRLKFNPFVSFACKRRFMINKISLLGILGVVTIGGLLISFTPANSSVDDLMCEKNDKKTGLCIVEGYFLRIKTVWSNTDDIECSWVWQHDWERGWLPRWFCCDVTYTTSQRKKATWYRYTFLVEAETEEVRRQRIADAVDDHIVTTVKRWNAECDSWEKGGPPVIGYDFFEGTYPFTEDDCNNIEMLYDGGFTEPYSLLDDSRLLEFKAVDWPDSSRLGEFEWPHYNEDDHRAGKIRINIGKLEAYEYRNTPGKEIWEYRDYRIKRTVAHERVHLADWLDNGLMQWFVPGEMHELFDLDQTHQFAKFIGERAAPFYPYWERVCLKNKMRRYIAGWGLDVDEIVTAELYCIVERF